MSSNKRFRGCGHHGEHSQKSIFTSPDLGHGRGRSGIWPVHAALPETAFLGLASGMLFCRGRAIVWLSMGITSSSDGDLEAGFRIVYEGRVEYPCRGLLRRGGSARVSVLAGCSHVSIE